MPDNGFVHSVRLLHELTNCNDQPYNRILLPRLNVDAGTRTDRAADHITPGT